MNTIDDLSIKKKTVVMRVDFNVPMKDGVVQDDTRIRSAIPSIESILNKGAKLVLLSHLGRPLSDNTDDGNIDRTKYSLQPVAEYLDRIMDAEVQFSPDTVGEDAKKRIQDLPYGQIIVMENTRFHAGEKKGDEGFARALSELGDVYINDAFGAAHREHASTATIARFFKSGEKGAGYLLQKEIERARKVLKDPERPYVAIIGGAKISDKIGLIDQMIEKADQIIIGGGMAYTFIKANGGNIGNSLLEEEKVDLAAELLDNAIAHHTRIILPMDSVVAEKFDADADHTIVDSVEIPNGWMGLDIGPKAIREFSKNIKKAKTIVWNGPMGVFEMEAFAQGTYAIAKAVAEATTQNNAYSLVGGGDSVSAVNKSGKADQISHISTGGGALLELLEGKTLPGIAALED